MVQDYRTTRLSIHWILKIHSHAHTKTISLCQMDEIWSTRCSNSIRIWFVWWTIPWKIFPQSRSIFLQCTKLLYRISLNANRKNTMLQCFSTSLTMSEFHNPLQLILPIRTSNDWPLPSSILVQAHITKGTDDSWKPLNYVIEQSFKRLYRFSILKIRVLNSRIVFRLWNLIN